MNSAANSKIKSVVMSSNSPKSDRKNRAKVLPSFLAICVSVSCCATSVGCSKSSSSKTNTVSPYDPEFEPDTDEAASKLAGTTLSATEQFAVLQEALEHYDAGLFTAARDALIDFQKNYPSSFYAPVVELKLADAQYFLSEYSLAIEAYQEFARLRPNHEAVGYAELQIANSHFAQYRGVVYDQAPLGQAEKQYQLVASRHRGSGIATQAEEMLSRCTELRKQHQSYVAGFYRQQGLDKASVNRLEKLLTESELTEAAPLLGERFDRETLEKIDKEVAPKRTEFQLANSRAKSDSSVSEARQQKNLALKKAQMVPNLQTTPSTSDAAASVTIVRDLIGQCTSKDSGTIFELLLPIGGSAEVQPVRNDRGWLIPLRSVGTDDGEFSVSELSSSTSGCSALGLTFALERDAGSAQQLLIIPGDLYRAARFIQLERPRRVVGLFAK
jgi:outer membrane protein assembly factor BamD